VASGSLPQAFWLTPSPALPSTARRRQRHERPAWRDWGSQHTGAAFPCRGLHTARAAAQVPRRSDHRGLLGARQPQAEHTVARSLQQSLWLAPLSRPPHNGQEQAPSRRSRRARRLTPGRPETWACCLPERSTLDASFGERAPRTGSTLTAADHQTGVFGQLIQSGTVDKRPEAFAKCIKSCSSPRPLLETMVVLRRHSRPA